MRDINNVLDVNEQAERYLQTTWHFLSFQEYLTLGQMRADTYKQDIVNDSRRRVIDNNFGGKGNEPILSPIID